MRLKDTGEVNNLESVFRCKDGSCKTALMSARIIELNSEPHILSITRDITDWKIMNMKLCESEIIYKTIVSIYDDGFLLVDDKQKILDTNDTYCKIIGYEKKELIGMSIFDIIQNETKNETLKPNTRYSE